MPPRLAFIAVLLTILPCLAQAQLSPAAKLSQVAANQLGIMEYCRDHGQASEAAVAAEREAFASAPAPSLSTVHAQELGRQGFSVVPDAEQITIAVWATREGTTISGLCKDLADSSIAFQLAMHKERDRMTAARAAK